MYPSRLNQNKNLRKAVECVDMDVVSCSLPYTLYPSLILLAQILCSVFVRDQVKKCSEEVSFSVYI